MTGGATVLLVWSSRAKGQRRLDPVAVSKRAHRERRRRRSTCLPLVLPVESLGPDQKTRIPTARAQRHSVGADTQTRDAVLVRSQNTDALALERIPDVACVVVVAGKEDTAGDGEADRSDAAEDVVVGVGVELAVGTQIEEAARGVVGTGGKGVAVGEELNGVDVALVAGKGLDRLAGTDVPNLGHGIAGTGDKDVGVGAERDAHDVAGVVVELGDARARVNVPENAAHVAGRGEDLLVVEEATAAEVAGMRGQLAADLDIVGIAAAERVDAADVVETTAGDPVARGSVGAGHDPRGAEGDGVHLVGGVGVPDDELSVLGSRVEVTLVIGPVHGVDLGEMALERPSWLHDDSGQGLHVVGHGAQAGIRHLILLGADLFLEAICLATCGGDALLQVGSWC